MRRSIGVVFQEMALDSQLTGKENLEFHAMMYGMGKTDRPGINRRGFGTRGTGRQGRRPGEKYSGGMKTAPRDRPGTHPSSPVLFLDEPTLGLDAQTRRHIWDYIKKLNRESDVTIILTTHYMEEADFLCESLAIIDRANCGNRFSR